MPRLNAIGRIAATCITLLSAATLAPGAQAEDKIDPSAYPELASKKLLPLIIADIKQNLPDPYSIRDLTVCPARVLKIREGHPVKWAVDLAMNVKGPSGAYTGYDSYTVGFKEGLIDVHIFTLGLGKDGLDGLVRKSVMKRVSACPSIPDATVQTLLSRPIGAGS